jgi:hypothetical protein
MTKTPARSLLNMLTEFHNYLLLAGNREELARFKLIIKEAWAQAGPADRVLAVLQQLRNQHDPHPHPAAYLLLAEVVHRADISQSAALDALRALTARGLVERHRTHLVSGNYKRLWSWRAL